MNFRTKHKSENIRWKVHKNNTLALIIVSFRLSLRTLALIHQRKHNNGFESPLL